MRTIRTTTRSARQAARAAVESLKRAREALREAGAAHAALDRVRSALKSAEGVVRHVDRCPLAPPPTLTPGCAYFVVCRACGASSDEVMSLEECHPCGVLADFVIDEDGRLAADVLDVEDHEAEDTVGYRCRSCSAEARWVDDLVTLRPVPDDEADDLDETRGDVVKVPESATVKA